MATDRLEPPTAKNNPTSATTLTNRWPSGEPEVSMTAFPAPCVHSVTGHITSLLEDRLSGRFHPSRLTKDVLVARTQRAHGLAVRPECRRRQVRFEVCGGRQVLREKQVLA